MASLLHRRDHTYTHRRAHGDAHMDISSLFTVKDTHKDRKSHCLGKMTYILSMLFTFCTYLCWSIFQKMQNLIPKHKSSFTCTMFANETQHQVSNVNASPQNNKTWRSPKARNQISSWTTSCSSNNFVYVCCVTRLERHLEQWDAALSPNIKRVMKYSPALLFPNSSRRINKT